MKKIFVVACLMTFALMVSAQDGQRRGGFQMTPEQRAQYYETLKKDLKLNDKQLDGIKKIDEKYQAKQREFRENNAGGDREKMREEFTKLRTAQNAEVKKLLSAEQFKKYEELQAQRMQRRGQGGGNRQN